MITNFTAMAEKNKEQMKQIEQQNDCILSQMKKNSQSQMDIIFKLMEQIKKKPKPQVIVINSCGGCFTPKNFVTLKSGKVIRIGDIKIGDSVLVSDKKGKKSHSDVCYVDILDDVHEKCKVIFLEGCEKIELTAHHFIYVAELKNGKKFGVNKKKVHSEELKIGDKLWVMNSNTMQFESKKILHILTKFENSVVTVHTMNNRIVVSKVLCNCYDGNYLFNCINCIDTRLGYLLFPKKLIKSKKWNEYHRKADLFFAKYFKLL